MTKRICPICSQTRGVEEHLFELGTMCELLGNESIYKGDDGPSIASLVTVGTWLKLGARLTKVEIDAWKFESSTASLMCQPAAEEITYSSYHLSNYSTSFTRFMFVSSALEELYRFVDQRYLRWVNETKTRIKGRVRPSIRAAILVDQIESKHWPIHFQHLCGSFCRLFERYRQRRGQQLSGMSYTDESKPSYGLHLIRNLRNDIAHGALLPEVHPDYAMDSQYIIDMLHVLTAAVLVTAIYIQLLVKAFNSGFQSDEYSYWQMTAEETEEDELFNAKYFLRYCNVDYLRRLHIQDEFALYKFQI
jgi:hypothetical protein